MYFWHIEGLKSKLATAPLTDREVLPYFIVYLVLMTAVALIPPENMNFWDYLTVAYAVLLSIFGTLYLFWKNGASGGVHFLQRYFAVGWVAAVRWIAFVFPPFVIFAIATGLPGDTNVVSFAHFAIAGLVLYQRIGHHISDVAARGNAI